ncbi:Hypothetical protein D9617_8g050610 [Elsinoe fawcettii]|nr:Hypothetical protein D9617_8g050610 [Elsinoe fawcettii]
MPASAQRTSKRKRPAVALAVDAESSTASRADVVECEALPVPKRRVKSEFDYQYVASILVGPEKTTFHVHAHILRKASPFFEAALSSRWNADEQTPIELPEDESRIFNSFVAWAYSGRVEGMPGQTDSFDHAQRRSLLEANSPKVEPTQMHAWVELYHFADKIQAIQLKNDIIDAFLAVGGRMLDMTSATMGLIWNDPPSEKDKLRSLLYHMMIWKAKPEHIHDGTYTDAPRLVASVLRYFLQRNPNKGPTDIRALNWHEPIEKR